MCKTKPASVAVLAGGTLLHLMASPSDARKEKVAKQFNPQKYLGHLPPIGNKCYS
jgi:hypothetical protein